MFSSFSADAEGGGGLLTSRDPAAVRSNPQEESMLRGAFSSLAVALAAVVLFVSAQPLAADLPKKEWKAAKKILEDALALPEKEREALVEALSDSLDPEALELSPEWTSVIRNRIAQIESGEAKTIPWDEVNARIRKSLTQK